MTSPRTLTAIALAASAMFTAHTHAAVFSDSFVLSTQGQNPWGLEDFDQTAGAIKRSYDSGFLGAKWGTYDGKAPVSFGLNAIAGNANELVPGTGGTVLNLAWSAWSVAKLGPEPAKYIPNPVPAQYFDSRTGFDLGVKTSGKLGGSVYAEFGLGELAMDLPFAAKLDVPKSAGQFEPFKILGSAVLGNTAAMEIKAPYLKTGVNASIHTDSQLGITGCFIGAGCSSVTQPIKQSLDFNVLDFDTRKAKPLELFGESMNAPLFNVPVPIPTHKGSIGSASIGMPRDLVGGEVTRGHAATDAIVTLQGRDVIVELDYDAVALSMILLPAPPLDLTLNLGAALIEGTVVKAEMGVDVWLNQKFSFQAGASVRLEFDRNVTSVYEEAGETRRLGRFVTIDLGPEEWGSNQHMSYYFEDGPGKLLSYEYIIDDASRLFADTSISIDLVRNGQVGCFHFEAPTADSVDFCAHKAVEKRRPGVVSDLPYWSSDTAISGFNTVTVAVPEPSTYAMLLLGLGVLGATARRRAREQQDTATTPQR